MISKIFSDTTSYLLSYSIEIKPNLHIVTIQGKCKNIFRELARSSGDSGDDYVWAAFRLDDNFSPFLTPINDPKELSNKVTMTFGIENDFLLNKVTVAVSAWKSASDIHSLVLIVEELFKDTFSLFKTEVESEFFFPFMKEYFTKDKVQKWLMKTFDKNKLNIEFIAGMFFAELYGYPRTLYILANSKTSGVFEICEMSSMRTIKVNNKFKRTLNIWKMNEMKVCNSLIIKIFYILEFNNFLPIFI